MAATVEVAEAEEMTLTETDCRMMTKPILVPIQIIRIRIVTLTMMVTRSIRVPILLMVLTFRVPVAAMEETGVMAAMEETAAEKKRKKCRFRNRLRLPFWVRIICMS